jgi:hypothetical protein
VDANFDILIDIAIKDGELTGYSLSKDTLKQFYNCFPGLYPGGTLAEYSAKKNTPNCPDGFDPPTQRAIPHVVLFLPKAKQTKLWEVWKQT